MKQLILIFLFLFSVNVYAETWSCDVKRVVYFDITSHPGFLKEKSETELIVLKRKNDAYEVTRKINDFDQARCDNQSLKDQSADCKKGSFSVDYGIVAESSKDVKLLRSVNKVFDAHTSEIIHINKENSTVLFSKILGTVYINSKQGECIISE